MQSHFLHMLLYSTIVALFFGALLRRSLRDQLRLGGMIWLTMVGGALLLAYVMAPFPR